MARKLAIGSRKGLILYVADGEGWRYDGVRFRGTPISMVMQDPRDGTLYAALDYGHFGPKLQRSDDGGNHWQEVTPPAFPKSDAADAPAVLNIWALEPAGKDMPGTIWAGTVPAGIFRSDDKGVTWTMNEPFMALAERGQWGGAGNDTPALNSISIHPDDGRVMAVAISAGGVWQTADGGKSWANTSKGLWAAYMPPDQAENPNIQDVHQMRRAPSEPDRLYVQHHNAVFTSADGGKNWQEISKAFGFAVAVHPKNPLTAWFVPAEKDEYRLPKDETFCVAKTEDGGKSFRHITRGLPAKPAFDLVLRHALDVDRSGNRLAFGSTTGNLWISSDGGEGWHLLSSHLPPIYCVRMLE
ncbi:WD40/YVTN/BNR-like repeat-containing protein [Dongia sp.]|uniref:WD40/YVTN/BNR-like repeat-containing protein n=1 Tax=Dongia sp. TaxID=1977262 RepID=UPI0035B20F66